MEIMNQAILRIGKELKQYGQVVVTEKWQGKENSKAMLERCFVNFNVHIPTADTLLHHVPPTSLEWVEAHFIERMGGRPLNPGDSYKLWPAYKNNKNNDSFRTVDEKFTHTYMERIWPKYAFLGVNGVEINMHSHHDQHWAFQQLGPIWGIRYQYGDLLDVIDLLKREPFTRQAYLPIWFPEDTGVLHGGRVPCSLGYLFLRRGNQLHVSYHLRSCDYLRHFRDDIYLTCKKVYYIISKLNNERGWENVVPGILSMKMDSLHIFEEDQYPLKQFLDKFEKGIL